MQSPDRQMARQRLTRLIHAIRPHNALEASQVEATMAVVTYARFADDLRGALIVIIGTFSPSGL